jgi:hypothetical protein
MSHSSTNLSIFEVYGKFETHMLRLYKLSIRIWELVKTLDKSESYNKYNDHY